jgi:hypothetical protein
MKFQVGAPSQRSPRPTDRPSCAATFAHGSFCAIFFNFAMSSAVQRRNVGWGIFVSPIKNIKMLRFPKSSASTRQGELMHNDSRFRALILRCWVCVGGVCMPRTGWTPSIVPNGEVQTVYLVVDCFGALGVAYRETDDGPRNHHHRSDVRAIQRPGPRRRLQHRRALGAGCLERYCPRNPNPQRYRWSRRSRNGSGLRRAPRRSRSAARHAAGETITKMLAQAAGDCVEAPVMIDELESKVDGWAEAEAALAAAQQMPEGTERIDALKKAGLLRLKADERRTAIRNARQNSD